MASINKDNRRFIYERDGNKCLRCGSAYNLTIDHIVPLSKGGINYITNYQTLCKSCNLKKGANILDLRKDPLPHEIKPSKPKSKPGKKNYGGKYLTQDIELPKIKTVGKIDLDKDTLNNQKKRKPRKRIPSEKKIIINKEDTYYLQLIDCNCNDCKHMVRDLSKPPTKGQAAKINYGHCSKFDKPVTFIPAICQIDTQECFEHRRTAV